ncbi:hypothetical protein BH20BAC1_BH20BAC1_22640 [soil metagenome]
MSPKILLYHAYGLRYLYNQVSFSLLTLYYHLNGKFDGIRIIVYTDRPKIFDKYKTQFPLETELLTQEILLNFKGEMEFVHRVKICILKDCFEKYKSDILYLDSDTYFTSSPLALLNEIRPGTSVMNSNDYDLEHAGELFENQDWLMIRRAIRDFEYTINGEIKKISLSTRMWNAGVIGLSIDDSYLLNNVLNLADQIYRNKKVFTAEQFSFSYFLQHHTQMIDSGDTIFHYWRYWGSFKWRQTYTYHLRKFFKNYIHYSVAGQSKKAYELTLRHDTLKLPFGIFYKLIKRLRLMKEIAVNGKLKNPID